MILDKALEAELGPTPLRVGLRRVSQRKMDHMELSTSKGIGSRKRYREIIAENTAKVQRVRRVERELTWLTGADVEGGEVALPPANREEGREEGIT